MASPFTEIEVDDRVVKVTNPDRVYFPATDGSPSGATKLDLVEYYLAVGPGIVNALYERPCMLHRFPKGLAGDKVHQKRVPSGAPPWLETVRLHFPRFNRTADELCVTELASVVWAVQMSTVEFHPWNSRRADPEKPDEWRIDLDPGPDCDFDRVRRVAHVAHEVLDELGAVGWPKTSGGNGDGTVSTPIRWDEVDDVEPRDLTIATVPARFAELGDLHEGIDEAVFDLSPLLEWAERDEAEGKTVP